MSYTALYRKFRPQIFDDVKGQDHIVTTLKNQIKAGRIGHAYLFCGTRGTGKTTVAKIFAKAVNCECPKDGNPCAKCEMCRNIQSGGAMNVIEIDAASNNGVDNIRELKAEVAYRPAAGKYKVYIIDEAHMLSTGAFNALLKTLEEPPEYVIFILATTELHKIPLTILSRCQQYNFRRISVKEICGRIREVMKAEGVEIEDRAVRYVAKAADGSMRDALSLLDQCISFYMGQKLTYSMVLDVLGTVDSDVFGRLLESLVNFDVTGALSAVEDLCMLGKELSQVTTDFIWYLRNLLLVKTSGNIDDVLDISAENLKQLKEEAKAVEAETLFRYIRIFSELAGQMRYAPQKRVLLEVALIKVCRPQMESSFDSLSERIRALEEKLKNASVVPQHADGGADAGGDEKEPDFDAEPAAKSEALTDLTRLEAAKMPTDEARNEKTAVCDAQAEQVEANVPEAQAGDIKEAVRNFQAIAQKCSGYLRSLLIRAAPEAGPGNKLFILADGQMAAKAIGKKEHIEEIEGLFKKSLGKKIEVEVRFFEEKPENAFLEGLKKINMEVIQED